MPKETIKTRSGRTMMEVRWTSDRDAQVGVVIDPQSDGPKTLREMLADFDDSTPEHQGLFITFDFVDRSSFNHAIRSLRKARDAVCGKDE